MGMLNVGSIFQYLYQYFQQDYENATQKILEQIDQVQGEIDSLNEKASEEILKVISIFFCFSINPILLH